MFQKIKHKVDFSKPFCFHHITARFYATFSWACFKFSLQKYALLTLTYSVGLSRLKFVWLHLYVKKNYQKTKKKVSFFASLGTFDRNCDV